MLKLKGLEETLPRLCPLQGRVASSIWLHLRVPRGPKHYSIKQSNQTKTEVKRECLYIEPFNHLLEVKLQLKEGTFQVTMAQVKLVTFYFTMITVQHLLVSVDLDSKAISHTEILLKTRIVQDIQ